MAQDPRTPARTAPRKRPSHLIDPTAPRQVDRVAAERSLTNVQRWVMSVLAVTTIFHMSAGLAIASLFVPDSQPSGQIGLNVIAAAFGVIAVAAGFAIHARPLLSPWLLLGVVPGIVGLVLVLR